jgi:hypothetical protein
MGSPLAGAPAWAISDRLKAAESFLRLGKEELVHARGSANKEREREAAEKAFHALLEALTARVQRYSTWAPTEHGDLRKWLSTKGDHAFLGLFDDAFLKLHVKSYYRGWVDRSEVDHVIKAIEEALPQISRDARRT